MDFLSAILQKGLAGMYPLCMIVGSSCQRKVLPQGDRVPSGTTEREERCVRCMAVAHRTASAAEIRVAVGTTVTQLIVTNRLLQGQFRVRRPVMCIPLTPNHCNGSGVKLELIGGRSGYLLCFLMKAGSVLVPVVATCWLEGGQVSACNQPVCSLDTLDLHLELWPGVQFPMTVGALSWLSHAP
ncbi:hypothetical protein AVEN_145391-1 [Araneus ventricosus]|uniref:Uncharacterized protein n=1 Tax=Araneus ventricosus TaxID=182803 RepID=A0A4Y2MBD1_ARAVE|nr:hypothetical protein AVEN_145391-1 [Araneus ventricosus]